MQIPMNDLSRWSESELSNVYNSISDVLRSGNYLNGLHTQEFCSMLSSMLNERLVVPVGNGTDALVLSLLALGVRRGDVVATVANAGGYATGAILRIGAIPLLIDVHPTTAQMSIADLEEKAVKEGRLRAVVVTHLFGLMADVSAIMALARRYELVVVEDCAQSIGATSGVVTAGASGHASTFSFYPTKNLGGVGDAGAVTFLNSSHYEAAKSLSQYGWKSRYFIERTGGMNSRIDEIQAAVLTIRARRVAEHNSRRRTIWSRYRSSLSNGRTLIGSDDSSFVAHLAVVVSNNRDADKKQLAECGVATSIHYPVLDSQQDAWKDYFVDVRLPNSERLVNQIFSVPCFPELDDSEVQYVCDALSNLG